MYFGRSVRGHLVVDARYWPAVIEHVAIFAHIRLGLRVNDVDTIQRCTPNWSVAQSSSVRPGKASVGRCAREHSALRGANETWSAKMAALPASIPSSIPRLSQHACLALGSEERWTNEGWGHPSCHPNEASRGTE